MPFPLLINEPAMVASGQRAGDQQHYAGSQGLFCSHRVCPTVAHWTANSGPDRHATPKSNIREHPLRMEVSLPWLLAKAAKRLLTVLRKEATRLLEKK